MADNPPQKEVLEKVDATIGRPTAAEAPAAAENTPSPTPASAVVGHHILIVEDDQFLRDLMERKLSHEGFTVDTAIEGEMGLKKITEGKPELVLLDIILPGLDGFSILERLKKDQATASIPVILLTNLGQRDDVDKGMKLGAVDYLVKAHFTPGDIVEKVKTVLKI